MPEALADVYRIQVNVTNKFIVLFKVIFAQSLLVSMFLCTCCCLGRTLAHVYDKMFIVYSVFLLASTGTFIYACLLRSRYPSRVCSGDFLD